MTGVRVERLGSLDLAALMDLERACFSQVWTEEQYRLGLERGAFLVFGVREGGCLAAYLAFSRVADEMEILNIAVRPDRRRRGHAKALMAFLLDWCRRNGVRMGFLDVRPSNVPAIDLYQKFGFMKVGVRKAYYPDTGEDALQFRLDIPQPVRI